jgi:ABC-type branched-subunit amino acid transport system substrate-binding protein
MASVHAFGTGTLRNLLLGTALLTALPAGLHRAVAGDLPGVTATEIKIGNTNAYSGPASAYSTEAKLETAFFKMINEQGGVAGHKIDFVSYDDGYSPPKTVEETRRLIEEDQVALLFNSMGTATNTAIERYVNMKKVPQLLIATGADKWGDYKRFPWTMGYQPSYRARPELASDVLHDERIQLCRCGHDAGGCPEWDRHHHDRLSEGPDRSSVQGRSGNERMACVHGEIHAGR